MNLQELLDVCQVGHVDDWALIPGSRPATSMMAGLFDPGFKEEARTRPLEGHSIAVYEPRPEISIVWPVPEDDDDAERRREVVELEWDSNGRFKNVRAGFVVIALGGAPVWQTLVWYLDWGSGIGGYVAHYSPIFDGGTPERPEAVIGWEANSWEIGLASLVNGFSHTAAEWAIHDPTTEVITKRSDIHPIAVQKGRLG